LFVSASVSETGGLRVDKTPVLTGYTSEITDLRS